MRVDIQTQPLRGWMTVKECAAYTGLTVYAIYNHIHRGTLPYHKLGGRVMFDPDEIDAAIRGTMGRRARKVTNNFNQVFEGV